MLFGICSSTVCLVCEVTAVTALGSGIDPYRLFTHLSCLCLATISSTICLAFSKLIMSP